MDALGQTIARVIRDVPDFPKPGILFKDITPLLADHTAFRAVIAALCDRARAHGAEGLIAIESRGFLFGAAMAYELALPLQLVRKPGKLPYQKISMSYDLEYGKDTLEMHADAIVKGQRVLIVDDLLATGGTMKACCDLVKQLGGTIVSVAVLIELVGLKGRAKIAPQPLHSVLQYE